MKESEILLVNLEGIPQRREVLKWCELSCAPGLSSFQQPGDKVLSGAGCLFLGRAPAGTLDMSCQGGLGLQGAGKHLGAPAQGVLTLPDTTALGPVHTGREKSTNACLGMCPLPMQIGRAHV